MMKQLLRAVLPDSLRASMRSSKAGQWLRSPSTMEMGVGRGLRFDPGPSNDAYASGNNELPVQNTLAAHLHAGDTFYDIGANVGFLTVIGAKLVGPGGFVYAFEPVPENATCVRRNVEINDFKNVQLEEKAVAAEGGVGQLMLASYSGGAALTTASAPPDATTILPVQMVSVDECVFSLKYRPPTLVKIDVEGAEMEVLQGMRRTMHEVRPAILYEIDDQTQAAFEQKYSAYQEYLEGVGYRVERLPDSYPNTAWIVGHALALPR